MPPYSRGDHMSVMYQHVQGKAPFRTRGQPQEFRKAAERHRCQGHDAVDKLKRYQSMDEFRTGARGAAGTAAEESLDGPNRFAFLKLGLAQGCSDVHLAVGVPPMLRLHGDLMPIKFRDLGDAELESYVDEILTEHPAGALRRTGDDLDFSYVSEDGGRFRVNIFPQGRPASAPPSKYTRRTFRAWSGLACPTWSAVSAIFIRAWCWSRARPARANQPPWRP